MYVCLCVCVCVLVQCVPDFVSTGPLLVEAQVGGSIYDEVVHGVGSGDKHTQSGRHTQVVIMILITVEHSRILIQRILESLWTISVNC